MANSIRISKQLSKRYPKPVVDAIKNVAERYHIKSFKAEAVQSDKKFYVAEGDSFTGVHPDGTTASFEVVNANNIGASGLSHKIGEQFSMPPELHSALGRFLKGELDNEFETLMGLWYDIRETDVLDGLMAQDKDALNEDKHLCPLPISIARRAIKLWSNEGDTVLDNFMGSGTTGSVSLELNRKFIGIELKPEYFLMSNHNLQKAVEAKRQMILPGI